MSAPIHRQRGTEASASLVALAAALLITTLATGCLRLVIGVTRIADRGGVPASAVTELASAASQVAVALSDGGSGDPLTVIRTLPGATLRDASSLLGGAGAVPINPAIADPALIERVYAERTGSEVRARQFTSALAGLVATGAQLLESDIRLAAGFDYPRIMGLITGEPILNVRTAPALVLLKLPELVAPDDEAVRAAVTRMIGALLDERVHREISAGELASAIETAAAAPGEHTPTDRARFMQQLTAYLGVRTWVWELELERDGWRGTAVIAHLPGHPAAIVLGLAVKPREPQRLHGRSYQITSTSYCVICASAEMSAKLSVRH